MRSNRMKLKKTERERWSVRKIRTNLRLDRAELTGLPVAARLAGALPIAYADGVRFQLVPRLWVQTALAHRREDISCDQATY